jgi:hypothetical protein
LLFGVAIFLHWVPRFFWFLQLLPFLCGCGFGGGVGLGWLVLAMLPALVGCGGVAFSFVLCLGGDLVATFAIINLIFVATFGIINLTL